MNSVKLFYISSADNVFMFDMLICKVKRNFEVCV